jgi:hypothetical protein
MYHEFGFRILCDDQEDLLSCRSRATKKGCTEQALLASLATWAATQKKQTHNYEYRASLDPAENCSFGKILITLSSVNEKVNSTI